MKKAVGEGIELSCGRDLWWLVSYDVAIHAIIDHVKELLFSPLDKKHNSSH